MNIIRTERLLSSYSRKGAFVPIALEDTLSFTVNHVSFTMIAVKGGRYKTGESSIKEHYQGRKHHEPVYYETLEDFYIGETEVT